MEMNTVGRFIVNHAAWQFVNSRLILPWVFEHLQKTTYRQALDLGCGAGYTSALISSHLPRARVVGVDYDPRQIVQAQRLHTSKRLEFLVEDGQRLGFPDSSFDAVFVFDALHHMEDYRLALRNVHRVLKHGGELYLVDVHKAFFNPLLRWIDNTQSFFTADDIASSLRDTGFSVVDQHQRLFLFYLVARKE